MATYPLTKISRTTGVEPDAGIKAEVADDGTIKYRKDRSGTAVAFDIVHEWIDETEYAALLTFISSNGYGPHDFTTRGIAYTITLVNDPRVVEHRGGLLMVRVPAIGVAT